MGEHGEHDERIPEPFDLLRCLVAMVTGGVGVWLGLWLGMDGGGALEEAQGYPMGRSSGFLSMGYLRLMCMGVGAPVGAVLGALGGHALLGGRGSFWAGLGAALLAMVPVAVVSVMLGLGYAAFPLLGLAVAVALEVSNMR